MHVLLLIDDMDIGGAQTHVLTLAKGLAQQGNRVCVVSGGGALEGACRAIGARTLSFPRPIRGRELVLYLPRLVLFLARLQKKERFDVLHAHTRRCALLLSLARPLTRGHLPKEWASPPPYRRCALRQALMPARIVTAHARFRPHPRRLCYWGERTIAVSQDLKEHLERHFGVAGHRVQVIPNGIDTKELLARPDRRNPAEFSVTFASRLDADCSRAAFALLDVTPDLARLAERRGRRLRVTLLGGGACLSQLRTLAEQSNRACGKDTVRAVGATDCPPDYFEASDVFVGVSRAALEAAGCGCAVVLGGNEGFGGVLREDNFAAHADENFCCRSCPPVTPEALLCSLTELLDTPRDRLREQIAAVRRLLERSLSLDKTVAETLSVYRAVLGRRRVLSVLIGGYAGCGNLGDDAILRRLVARWQGKTAPASLVPPPQGDRAGQSTPPLAPALDPPLRLRVSALVGACDQGQALFGIPCFDRRRPTAVLRALRKADALVLGGGTLLQNRSAHGGRSLAYYLALLCGARALGRPFYLVAGGCGPLHGRVARRAVACTLRGARGISVRDPLSLSLLTQLGFPQESLSTEPDPVCALSVPGGREREDGANALFCPPCPWSDVLCVAPRAAAPATLAALSEAVAAVCRQKRLFPLFIALDSRRDRAVCAALCRSVGQGSVVTAGDENDLACALSLAHATLSMRLHGLVLAAAGGGRVVALSYDDRDTKLSVFAESEGMPALGAGASAEDITEALLGLGRR